MEKLVINIHHSLPFFAAPFDLALVSAFGVAIKKE